MSEADRREGGEDRRKTTRTPIMEPVSLTFTGALQGEIVDMSARGAFVGAKGPVRVRFRFQGHDYQARLVRVVPADSRGEGYAIELRDPSGLFGSLSGKP